MSEDTYMMVSKTTCGLVWICRTGWLIRILNFLGCLLAKGVMPNGYKLPGFNCSTNGPQFDDPTTVWSLLHPRLVGSSHVFHSPQRLQCSPNLWHGSNGQCTHFQYQGHIAAQCSPPKYVNSPELMSSFPQNIVCHPLFGPSNACGNQDVSLTAKTRLFHLDSQRVLHGFGKVEVEIVSQPPRFLPTPCV
jgi:hypothetical protein